MPHAPTWSSFDLQELIGEGQSGTVYRASVRRSFFDVPTGAIVAVKRYKPWVLQEPGQLDRVFREVDVGRRLQHPKLLRILAAVTDDSGRPALVMAYHPGQTLGDILKQHRSLGTYMSAEQGFGALRDLAEAIHALQAAGITHRDVKPANIMFSDDGCTLADLGVVRCSNFPEQTTTGAF